MRMEALVYPFLVSNILFFVYETDFFVEYIKLFRLNRVFGVDTVSYTHLTLPTNREV